MFVVEQFKQRSLESGHSFAGLMELFELNYLQLKTVVPTQDCRGEYLLSEVGDGLDLYIQILERHRYTTVLSMTYIFESEEDYQSDPNAQVRIYHDACVAEVTACHPGAKVARLCGMGSPDRYSIERNWTRNGFLYKWLEYLIASGHSLATTRPIGAADLPAVITEYGERKAYRPAL